MENMAENNELLTRDKIEEKYKWKLEHIYSDIEKWENEYKKVKELASNIGVFNGKLAESSDTLLQCIDKCGELLSLGDKIFVYARMKRDEDNSNTTYQELTDRAMSLTTEAYAAISFIAPEIISIPEEKLENFLTENSKLAVYRHYINENLRQKQHILSNREEEILALSGEIAEAPHDIFAMYNNADIKFPIIKDEDGNDVELTKGRYVKFLEADNRDVRKQAFEAMYSTYSKQKNMLGATLSSNVKKNKFYATVRKYDSCLQASLDGDNVPVNVYDNLIFTVNNNLGLLQRYLRLRRKALKLDTLNMYDLYVPIVDMPKKKIPYETALNMVEKGLAPMGEDYITDLKKAYGAGWIDVFETVGKTSGAYAWGSYHTHPYVLLNYQETINDVFTLAHEMGHALHSFYTNKTQPYIYSEYKIFVAEVASTVNESLLSKYLLANTSDKAEKAYLLNHHLEEFRGTVFRQVMFAEFEKIVHSMAQNGEALSAQTFCDVYYDLNKKYFGDEVEVDKEIAMEWARIPHFYTSFYVYKYATGFSAAASLSKQIVTDGGAALDRYKQFLSSGGCDYPLELLKKAGIDLSTSKPVEDAMKQFEAALIELEGLLL